jgi:general secretion pathway protein J
MNRYYSLGYTLLEIMIALAVFAIVATISASAMYQAFDTRARVNVQAQQLNTIQLALSFITRDTEQIIERATLGNEMHSFAPFIGQANYVEFTRGGFVNPTQALRSTLQRVAYLCMNKKLIRRSWHHLDIPKRNQHEDRIIFDNVEACEFAYLNHSHQTLSEWRAYAMQQNQNRTTSPIAIQMSITLRHLGNMNLLFPIPGALYAAK